MTRSSAADERPIWRETARAAVAAAGGTTAGGGGGGGGGHCFACALNDTVVSKYFFEIHLVANLGFDVEHFYSLHSLSV